MTNQAGMWLVYMSRIFGSYKPMSLVSILPVAVKARAGFVHSGKELGNER
jgi:hypothetical protein